MRIASSRRKRAQAVRIAGVFGLFEAHRHVALRGQVVDLVGLHLLHDADQVAAVGQVAVVQDEAPVGFVRVLVQVVDAARVEARRAALDAVHLVALGEQEFGQIGAVLAGHAGNEGTLVGFHAGHPLAPGPDTARRVHGTNHLDHGAAAASPGGAVSVAPGRATPPAPAAARPHAAAMHPVSRPRRAFSPPGRSRPPRPAS